MKKIGKYISVTLLCMVYIVKKTFAYFLIVLLFLGLAPTIHRELNLTPLQKEVINLGFEHQNRSETIENAYTWHPQNPPSSYCNSLFVIEVYDIHPNDIDYTCQVESDKEFIQYGYVYDTETNKLSIKNLDFSHKHESLEDKKLYEKVYNENFKQYNEKIVDKLKN